MNKEYLIKEAITKAAALARCDKLSILRGMCETQKTISTNKVDAELDKIDQHLKDCAYLMRALVHQLRK